MAVPKTRTDFTEEEKAELREIGDKLRKAREAAGLTQMELANRVGADRATISHYEGGTGGYMGGAMMYRICEELRIELNDLSPSRLIKKHENVDDRSIDAILARVPKAQREMLIPGLMAMLGTYVC